MCCIFTCCGWMIDLIQRAWTFTMSCIIMTAVGSVMVTASMSGIALGYNYSLAEYIDLKETNVSVYLKRGVFDDEIADDMDWRRAGHLPVQGQLKDDNLRTGAFEDEESTTLRSGRRLDDSVFEADDHNKYEGSLMKLTAKPPIFQDTPMAGLTGDDEMAATLSKFSLEPLDQMKAIQSLIDSRRAMATGGTTISPLATYEAAGPILPYLPGNNNPNLPTNHPEVQYRRVMAPMAPYGPGNQYTLSPLNPARLAVPDPASLESEVNWLGPKQPAIFVQSKVPEFFISSPTYPPPVTVSPSVIRPTGQGPDGRRFPDSLAFPYFTPLKPTPTPPSPTRERGLEEMQKQPDFYNEKIMAEGNEFSKNDNMNKPPKWGIKSPEEEYEDEIKGLPVRKRRSIDTPAREETNRNVIQPVGKENTKSVGSSFFSMIKTILANAIRASNVENSNKENKNTTDKNQSVVEEIKNSQIGIQVSDEANDKHPMDTNDKRESDIISKVNSIPEQDKEKRLTTTLLDHFEANDKLPNPIDTNNKRQSDTVTEVRSIPEQVSVKKRTTMLDHLVTSIKTKEATLASETTSKTDVESSTAKKIKIKTIRRAFESKIVSSKYVSSNLARLKKKQPFSNQEILNSISVGLNEAGLLRDPSSSLLVKLLQATLTA